MAPMEFLPGCPDNNKKFRMIGMGVAVVSFIFIIVGLVAIQISGGGESLGSILSISLGDGGTVILVFAIITILVALIAILIPIFSVISGISLIASLCLILMNTARYPSVSMSSIIIIAVIAILAMAAGIVASTFMAKYARSNVRNVTLMQCSVISWLGVNKLGGNSK